MAREEDFILNLGYVAQHPHAYLLDTPSVAIQPEVPGKMQIGPSLFGAQKFSI